MTPQRDQKVTTYLNFLNTFDIGHTEYALNSLIWNKKLVGDPNGRSSSQLSPFWQIWGGLGDQNLMKINPELVFLGGKLFKNEADFEKWCLI